MKIMRQNEKAGFSLVEVMVSILLLMVLVLGGAAVMYQSGGGIQRQQSKREAVVAANDILEGYWNTSYQNLGHDANNSITTNITVNGRSTASTIEVSPERDDEDAGNHYYEIHISVPWMDGDTVEIVSRRYEKGLSKVQVN